MYICVKHICPPSDTFLEVPGVRTLSDKSSDTPGLQADSSRSCSASKPRGRLHHSTLLLYLDTRHPRRIQCS